VRPPPQLEDVAVERALVARLRERYATLDAEASHTALRVLRSGRAWLDPAVSEERLAAESRGADHLALMRALGFRAEIVVPLVAGDGALGTITLVGGEGRSYDRDDLALAEELGRRCATAIANAGAFAAAEEARREALRAAERTRHLQEITQQLSRSLDVEDLLDAVARSAAALLAAPVGAVFLLDRADGEADFALVAAHGIDAARVAALRLPRHASLAGRAVDEGRTLVVDDARAVAGTALPALLTGQSAGSEIAAPITAGEERLGVVKAFSPTARRFRPDDAELLSALAAAAAVALTNARLYREARDAIRARDEFLSSAAHDLRTPLTGLKGMAQLLLRQATAGGAPDPGRLVEGLTGLDASATRAARQVDQLLDITRLRAGEPLELQRRPTDLVALARGAVAEWQQASDAHRIRITDGDAQLVGHWDAGRLERVLDNLLSNAVKYSPAGGEVLVALRREEDGAGSWAVVAVQDRGIGVPRAELDRIFERFRRGSNVPVPVVGSGIGLASVRQIVEQHGGEVAVESEEGAGSTFTVRLPIGAVATGALAR
jgi:signal transduction histidine kinase